MQVFLQALQKWPRKIPSASFCICGRDSRDVSGGSLFDPCLEYLFRSQIQGLRPLVGSGHFRVVENSMAALQFHSWHYDAIQA